MEASARARADANARRAGPDRAAAGPSACCPASTWDGAWRPSSARARVDGAAVDAPNVSFL